MEKQYVVYTTLMRRKDGLSDPVEVDPAADYICYTDEPERLNTKVYKLVKMKKIEDRKEALYDQKKHKMCPHIFAELHRYPFSVFHDANMQVKGTLIPLLKELKNARIGFFSNSLSNTIKEEAEIFYNMIDGGDPNILDTKDKIKEQIDIYQKLGYPDDRGIMTSGVILRNQLKATPTMKKFNELWWRETNKWNLADQISLNYSLWESGISFKDFGHTVWGEIYRQFFIYWRHNY